MGVKRVASNRACHLSTSGAIIVSAAEYHSRALTVEGVVKYWGSDYWSQLGNGRGTVPLDVVGLGRMDYTTPRYLPYVGIRQAGR